MDMKWEGKEIEILYKDKNVLAINKPAGLAVHGDGKSDEATLADLLIKEYPPLKDVGDEPDLRPGIVHRLDRETSGVMIIARNQETFLLLKEQFQNRKIEKIYYAYTYGWIKNDFGTINMPIGRSGNDIRMWTAGKGKRGTIREARTDYEVLKRLPEDVFEKRKTPAKGSTEEGTYTFVKLMPKTGRTHQLRVHLKYINHPILCDSLYAAGRPEALGFSRTALHAASLSLILPSGKKLTIEAPFPKDFNNAL
jgi:23S rRNA pseudouridine1911/1915/1917 synthase